MSQSQSSSGKYQFSLKEISEEEFESLNKALKERYDIDFVSYESKSLRRQVSKVMGKYGFNSVIELWQKLMRDREFVKTYINEMTVGMTSMFRDPIMWKYLREEILPILAKQKEIRIWHAACSTGEEVYTLAMMLDELNLLHKTKAIATDLNTDSLRKAEAGRYHFTTKRQNEKQAKDYDPKLDLSKYYTDDESYFVMDRKLRSHVRFQYHDLTKGPLGGEKFDLVFCRNVMIYFDQGLKVKVTKSLYQNLVDKGFLITGFFDASLPIQDDIPFLAHKPNMRIYKKDLDVIDDSNSLNPTTVGSVFSNMKAYQKHEEQYQEAAKMPEKIGIKRVFVVENDNTSYAFIREILKLLKYEIVGRQASGAHAIFDIPTKKPDVIISGLKLDGRVDGVMAMNKIREKSDIPVVFVSKEISEEDKKRVEGVRNSVLLEKSIGINKLKNALAEANKLM